MILSFIQTEKTQAGTRRRRIISRQIQKRQRNIILKIKSRSKIMIDVENRQEIRGWFITRNTGIDRKDKRRLWKKQRESYWDVSQ
jgi:hypothetical protein